jgi:hypothetical protein
VREERRQLFALIGIANGVQKPIRANKLQAMHTQVGEQLAMCKMGPPDFFAFILAQQIILALILF